MFIASQISGAPIADFGDSYHFVKVMPEGNVVESREALREAIG